jgi:hypothetical protein
MMRGSNWKAALSNLAVEGPAIVSEVEEVFECHSPFLPAAFSRKPVAVITEVTPGSAIGELVQLSRGASRGETRAENPGETCTEEAPRERLARFGNSAESVSKSLLRG